MKENKFSIEGQEHNKELVDSFFEEFSKMSSEEQDRVLGLLKEKAVSKGKNYKPEIEELEQR
ncbi:MAG: hypothetical protein AAB340_01700 [Patescibacteria group bacterium]